MKTVLALCVCATLFAVGCAIKPAGSFCDIAKPIRLSAASVLALTDAEVEKALAFNRKGQALCGWKP